MVEAALDLDPEFLAARDLRDTILRSMVSEFPVEKQASPPPPPPPPRPSQPPAPAAVPAAAAAPGAASVPPVRRELWLHPEAELADSVDLRRPSHRFFPEARRTTSAVAGSEAPPARWPDAPVAAAAPVTPAAPAHVEARARLRRVERCIERARQLMTQGALADARRALDEARTLSPSSTDVALLLSEIDRVEQRLQNRRRMPFVAAAIVGLSLAGGWFIHRDGSIERLAAGASTGARQNDTAPQVERSPRPPRTETPPDARPETAPRVETSAGDPAADRAIAVNPADSAATVARDAPETEVAREQTTARPTVDSRDAPLTANAAALERPPVTAATAREVSRTGTPAADAPRFPPDSSQSVPIEALAAPGSAAPAANSPPAATPVAPPMPAAAPGGTPGGSGLAAAATPPPTPVPEPAPVPGPAPAPPAARTAAIPGSADRTVADAAIDRDRGPDDDQLVLDVLQRYRAAYDALDASSARAVWPSVNTAALAKAFGDLTAQQLRFSDCGIRITGGAAQATCHGTARYVPKVGGRQPREEARVWSFALRKNGPQWLIESARVSAP